MTNREMLNDMSDEELAEMFGYTTGDYVNCEHCRVKHLCSPKNKEKGKCRPAWEKWLEQDIEED